MEENIYINETSVTPLVCINEQGLCLRMKGVLIPEDSISFFKPIFDWLENYSLNPKKGGEFVFEFKYFNTTSSVMLLFMMRRIIKIQNQTITWIITPDDEDMIEVVNDYNEILGDSLNIVLTTENTYI